MTSWDVVPCLGQKVLVMQTAKQDKPGKFYTFFVDGTEHRVDRSLITAGEIMDLAGIPREVGLLLCEEDGTQRQLSPDEEIELKPGRRFRKAPRFKRG